MGVIGSSTNDYWNDSKILGSPLNVRPELGAEFVWNRITPLFGGEDAMEVASAVCV